MGILERISKLDDSFYERWQTGKYGEEFHTTYQKLSNDIAELGFTDCFVDLSNTRGWVDINLWFGNGLFVSVCRPIDATDDIDFFSISHNKKKIIIDKWPHADLMKKLKDAENIVKEGSKCTNENTSPSTPSEA